MLCGFFKSHALGLKPGLSWTPLVIRAIESVDGVLGAAFPFGGLIGSGRRRRSLGGGRVARSSGMIDPERQHDERQNRNHPESVHTSSPDILTEDSTSVDMLSGEDLVPMWGGPTIHIHVTDRHARRGRRTA